MQHCSEMPKGSINAPWAKGAIMRKQDFYEPQLSYEAKAGLVSLVLALVAMLAMKIFGG